MIAAANYLGYFVGAVDSIFARSHHHVRGRLYGGLWLCVLLTLASYWAYGFWPHLLLRFGTGVASAWALAIAARRARLGALVFAGPGLGILLTGLLALVCNLLRQNSATLWLVYGAVALLMLLAILPFLPKPCAACAPGASQTHKATNGSIAHLCSILLHFPLQLVFFVVALNLGVDREFFYSKYSLLLFCAVLIPLCFYPTTFLAECPCKSSQGSCFVHKAERA